MLRYTPGGCRVGTCGCPGSSVPRRPASPSPACSRPLRMASDSGSASTHADARRALPGVPFHQASGHGSQPGGRPRVPALGHLPGLVPERPPQHALQPGVRGQAPHASVRPRRPRADVAEVLEPPRRLGADHGLRQDPERAVLRAAVRGARGRRVHAQQEHPRRGIRRPAHARHGRVRAPHQAPDREHLSPERPHARAPRRALQRAALCAVPPDAHVAGLEAAVHPRLHADRRQPARAGVPLPAALHRAQHRGLLVPGDDGQCHEQRAHVPDRAVELHERGGPADLRLARDRRPRRVHGPLVHAS